MLNKLKYPIKSIPISINAIHLYNTNDVHNISKNTFRVNNTTFLKKYKKTKFNTKTIKSFLNGRIKDLIDVKLSLTQIRQINHILYMINNYNVYISIKVLAFMLNNNMDNNLFRRLCMNSCLKSVDSRLNRIILLGYNNGIIYWKKHKSDRVSGNNNPAFQHNGRLSSLSKNFHKYEQMNDEEKQNKIDIVGNKISKSRLEGQNSSNQINYWTKRGYSIEDSKHQISKRQSTFSLRMCIDKYGKKDGIKIFQERQLKWQDTLNNKTDEEKIDIRFRKSCGLFDKTFTDTDTILNNGTLYYIRFFSDDIEFWKIGITKHNIDKRFGSRFSLNQKHNLSYEVIFEFNNQSLYTAWLMEQHILKIFYKNRIVINYNNFTTYEAFNKDIKEDIYKELQIEENTWL